MNESFELCPIQSNVVHDVPVKCDDTCAWYVHTGYSGGCALTIIARRLILATCAGVDTWRPSEKEESDGEDQ